jgi:serine/threonine-protein kinase
MPRVGDVVAGKYRLEKVAGEGGMGIVYAAQHLVLKQLVAVKVLLPSAASSEAVVERFSREAQAAARINSEHVARVLDAGSLDSGAPFLVMEYLEGCDLEELLELEGKLPLTDVADYMLQALEALAHAHAVGLVHRDLKPANLFLASRQDGGNVLKMLDFGISKSIDARPEDKKLTGQHVLGSPVYMSPEQLRNAKEIDARADLWSIGVVAYELLTGKPPFDGDGVGEIFAAILEKEATPVHLVDWKLPEELSAVLAKCLARNPDDRWQNAAELARAIAPFGSGAWKGLVSSTEQVLARSKFLRATATPIETRRVVDAIEAAAARARTTVSGTKAEAAAPVSERLSAPQPAPEPVAEAAPARVPRRAGIAAAAAVVAIAAAVAGVAAVRSTRLATAASSKAAVDQTAVQASTVKRPDDPAGAKDEGADDADAPMVMDLPDTPGHASGGTAQRSRGGKPSGKPQRPKFLNSRE